MAADFNSVLFVGRLGKDPQMSYTPNGNAVTKFSIAVNRRKVGNKEQPPMWLNVVCWQKLAEIVNEYASKGVQILVQGSFDQQTYKDKDGIQRIKYEIVASNVQLLGKKQQASEEDELGELEDYEI
ncbi:single-stranded DNA-binding protein [Ktedonosporobacter rubrisoli]|uniref:Single-stranded DNA-binding protein n=1 Tax=Ktedonosporobacter rubrisoli TaxID=2509675 RepID=A0A4P6JSZ0_KTERU|nr:single-stranded DNA-binding protein [Ktedonosporobacter rubrisoli]QBD77996.1 single-stranded DNA-binding protein [Ktedonosporobacter rubrisoli]